MTLESVLYCSTNWKKEEAQGEKKKRIGFKVLQENQRAFYAGFYLHFRQLILASGAPNPPV